MVAGLFGSGLNGAHVGNIVGGHETRENGHDHLLLRLGNVFRQGIDTGADLSAHRYCVLGVSELLLQVREYRARREGD